MDPGTFDQGDELPRPVGRSWANLSFKIEEPADPRRPILLTVECEHARMHASYRKRCTCSYTTHSPTDPTPECAGLNPTRATLEQYAMGLHLRRMAHERTEQGTQKYPDGCVCNQAYWCQHGPVETFSRLHPCHAPEGPLDTEAMAAIGMGRKLRPINPDYIATVKARWPYHMHGPLGPSGDHPGHPNCGHGPATSGDATDAPGL